MSIKNLRPYARRAVVHHAKAEFSITTRYHVAYQILIVNEGEVVFTVSGVSHVLRVGSVMLVPPNEPLSYKIVKDTEWMIVDFDAEYSELSRYRNISSSLSPEELPGYRRIYIQKNVYDGYELPFVGEPDNVEEFRNCFWSIKEGILKNNSFVTEMKMIKLLNMFHKLMGISVLHTKPDVCEMVKEYIDAGFDEIITLDKLEQMFGVNKYTLLRNFKKRYNVSVISYYNQKRVQYAKEGLEARRYTISDIAKHLNFVDVYTFSKFFKAHVGVSPKFYRKGVSEANGEGEDQRV